MKLQWMLQDLASARRSATFLIGLVEEMASTYLGAKFALPALFAVVFVTLTIRPNGLFGLSQEQRL